MGCNCGKKRQDQSKVQTTRKKNEPSEISVQQSTPITYQQILEVENMLGDINSNAEKRSIVIDFVKEHFGEVIMSYCDQICIQRLRHKFQQYKERFK